MIVPRKSDQFHDDLYPDTAASKPALSAQEWIKGSNAMPILMSMKTGKNLKIPLNFFSILYHIWIVIHILYYSRVNEYIK